MKKTLAVAIALALSMPAFATDRRPPPTKPQEPVVVTEYVYTDSESSSKKYLYALTGVVIGIAVAAILCYNSDKCMGDNVAREKAATDPNPDSIVPANANPGQITIQPIK